MTCEEKPPGQEFLLSILRDGSPSSRWNRSEQTFEIYRISAAHVVANQLAISISIHIISFATLGLGICCSVIFKCITIDREKMILRADGKGTGRSILAQPTSYTNNGILPQVSTRFGNQSCAFFLHVVHALQRVNGRDGLSLRGRLNFTHTGFLSRRQKMDGVYI